MNWKSTGMVSSRTDEYSQLIRKYYPLRYLREWDNRQHHMPSKYLPFHYLRMLGI